MTANTDVTIGPHVSHTSLGAILVYSHTLNKKGNFLFVQISLNMPMFKVWSGDRRVKKTVMADTVEDLKQKGNHFCVYCILLLVCLWHF